MAIVIVATPGSVSANSFVTEAEFIARAATRRNVPVGTTVTGTTCSEDEKKAMLEAAECIAGLPYDGMPTTSTQALPLPRTGLINPDAGADAASVYFDDDVIPDRAKRAQIDLTLAILAGTFTPTTVDDSVGVIRKKVDVLETEWESGRAKPQGLARLPHVLTPLLPLLASRSGLELLRG